MGKLSIKHDQVHYLPFGERDRSLLGSKWPNASGLDAIWKISPRFGCPQRKLEIEPASTGKAIKDDPVLLTESILRFPSAPVYATHDARQHAYKVKEHWPNFHTMRVLTRKNLSQRGARHVFLLHNGLNETRDISFHYRLASWILSEQEDAACVIRPLPAHLNRFFFQSPFTELPLDEYLQDPASVFRQFLRYMLETQWLLSVLVPRSDYEIMTGCELLLYDKKDHGRTDSLALAEEIKRQANRTLDASKQRSKKTEQGDTAYSPEHLQAKDVLNCIETLRGILGWSPASSVIPSEKRLDKPAIHVVGYSMGGFIAQSIFCAWPFAIASCSNLFSGGALRDLAPTAFADPEEWQSVLHGLRSELAHARVKGWLSPVPPEDDVPNYVVGIKKRTFDYFERIFEDVFLQSDRGSYSTRLAEFSRRLLFILGGDDPIVRTRNVLDAAPPGGITLHQIGDVSHFQDSRNKEPAELEQRDFWLPETGRMIGRFADRAAVLLQQTNRRYWSKVKRPPRKSPKGRSERKADGALANMQFERELDSMLTLISGGSGWLFIARNQVPTVFLGAKAFRTHAAAMHHSEDLIGEYIDALTARAKRLQKLKNNFSLLIPVGQVLSEGGIGSEPMKSADTARDRAMFSKSEVAIRYWPSEQSRRLAWENFSSNWCRNEAVHCVTMNEYAPAELGKPGELWASEHEDGADKIAVTMLPDVWIAIERAACEELFKMKMSNIAEDKEKGAKLRKRMERGMIDVACELIEKKKLEAEGKTTPGEKLREFLATGSVRVVKVSPAEFNPRYRGRLLDESSRDTGGVGSLFVHWAMAYGASRPVLPIERAG